MGRRQSMATPDHDIVSMIVQSMTTLSIQLDRSLFRGGHRRGGGPDDSRTSSW